MTRNIRFFLLLLLLTSCYGLRANSTEDEAPEKISCMTSEFAQQGNENWRIITLTLVNECNYNIDLNNVLVEFKDNQPIENIWFTDNDNTSYPEVTWSSQTDIHRLELVFDSKPYVQSTLKPQKTISLNYGVPFIGYASESVAIYYNRNDAKMPFSSTDPSTYSPRKPSVISPARTAEQTIGHPKIQRMIGYLPLNWNNSESYIGSIPSPNELSNANYTHILIAFGVFSIDANCAIEKDCILLSPHKDGDIQITSGDGSQKIDLKTYVMQLHQQGIKVLLSLGGASSSFGTVDFERSFNIVQKSQRSFTKTARAYADSITRLAQHFNFDGIDIDIEAGLSAPASTDLITAGSVKACQSLFSETTGLTAQTGSVCAMTEIVNQLVDRYPEMIITLAPQTLNIAANRLIQGQTLNYSALIANIRNHLTWVGVQVYNSGGMYGPDGKIQPINADNQANASVAMALNLLEVWTQESPHSFINNTQALLEPHQVVLGYPASNGQRSDGYPSGDLNAIIEAVSCLNYSTHCKSIAPRVALSQPIGGVFNWNVNFDRANDFIFAKTLMDH
ncbi:MAG: chitinase [Candidatus Azotimanducaceae bacterium]